MIKTVASLVLIWLGAVAGTNPRGYNTPACQEGRQVIVHLFEWKWKDIAKECEEYLGPKGYCGVQVSPPNEHIQGGQWWTRYQPVSYKLDSRSGSRSEFISMVSRCGAVGVNIVVDGVINHMSGLDGHGTGTGGSSYNGGDQSYPGVPFSNQDFHQPICYIENYGNPTEVRNCYLVGLNDLAGGKSYVQEKIAGFLQDCVDIGVTGFRIDAAKHMWPDDIKGTIDRVGDLPSGGRPFFFHEVIDQGGEPIKVQEYFGVGQVTEFRYGIKVADAIKGGNYAALGGVYDQGWGMADPAHATVFIDNHDNQRGHGGGGDHLLTHKDPYNYKLGVSFMLAHDYGFKRVMSSYYFSNTDQGPPGQSPGCGGDWACEHRWDSIGNMVQFTNAVAGTGVENWVARGDMVAFSRGNKGFYAMGKMDGEYDTGLPDGDYCDIISECKQTIKISGGRGSFKAHSGEEPVVAICVGCGNSEPGTTHKPATTTHKPATTHKPDDTTAKPGPTTPEKTTVPATTAPGWCCSDVVISSSGGVMENYPELLGKYTSVGEDNGRDVFKHSTILFTAHLHYTVDPQYKWEGWMITKDADSTFGYIANEGDLACPVGLNSGWEFQLPSGWEEDPSFQITCEGDPTSGPDPTGGPTGGPTTGPTQPPGPDGVARTIMVVEKVTTPGSDVFIVGGVSPDQMIDISIHAMPAIWERQNAWMVGDDHLDWDGPEPGQGTFEIEGTDYAAFGTAGAWTTDDVTNDFYYELNTWGDHFWFIDMDMDCGQTQGGWFEFNTIYTIGGEDGEAAVSQEECTGEVGGTAPFTSTNHIARCGFMNVFSYGKDKCQIDNVPA